MILPGQTIGILGGGQLGRMFALFARRMGYRVHALDPSQDCPTGQIADREINATYDNLDAAREFASGVDVVTFEFENVPAETLATIAELKPVHPSPQVLDICRHRVREKEFLASRGFPVAPHRAVRSAEQLAQAVAQLGTPCILKTADFGYDGKGQVRISEAGEVNDAWRRMGRPVGLLEAFVPFSKELSVICARAADGQAVCFPPAENVHRNHILDVTTVPADVPTSTKSAAIGLAQEIASALGVVGLLTVEMFLVSDDHLIVNELAPRPHNSGHYSFEACVTSQFEQQLRAVCGLPLGDTSLIRPVAMVNLLGDLWSGGEPNWSAALRHPAVKLHLYGKLKPQPGRKMGHLTAMAESAAEAREIVIAARNALTER